MKGYEFYRSIGSPKFISAPMVDHSSLAWRLLVQLNGADLAYSEMLASKAIISSPKKFQKKYVDWDIYTRHHENMLHGTAKKLSEIDPFTVDRPIIAQLQGNTLKDLIQAGKIIETTGVAALDLNLGCPQKCAKKGSYGGYLLNNEYTRENKQNEPVLNILKGLVNEMKVPITVKIRKLDSDDDETIEFCQQIEECGVSMLTVHGRRVRNINEQTGSADWEIIRKVKQHCSIPIIANGGIGRHSDVQQCLEYTKADGVMSSECLLENPLGLFNTTSSNDANPTSHSTNTNTNNTNNTNNTIRTSIQATYLERQLQAAREYIQLEALYTDPTRGHGVFYTRNHICKILYRILQGAKNKDLRGMIGGAKSSLEVYQLVDQLSDRIDMFTTHNPSYNLEMVMDAGLCGRVNWYDRHLR